MRRQLPLNLPSLLLAVLAACGCASYDGRTLQPGVATEADVRGLMGVPGAEYASSDGARHLIYPKGPLGTQTFSADLAPDGRLVAVRQLLGEEAFRKVVPGMTAEAVGRLIGPPGEVTEFSRLRQTAWDYRFVDAWGFKAIFSVNFDAQWRVVNTFTQRIERMDSSH